MTAMLVVGEALVDVVAGTAHPGGSPMNVAVGLARLGAATTLHTHIGQDAHGSLIERHLTASGVVLTDESRDGNPTSIAEATIGADGDARYRFAVDGALAVPSVALDTFDAVHTGSIAAVCEPGASRIEALLTAARPVATISYDPNIRPELMGAPDAARARVERLIASADVVKASDDDIAWLYPDAAVDDVAASWLASGPAVVAITRGGKGSTIVGAAGTVDVVETPVTVVDTIGAGDSYMAGLLTALGDASLFGADKRQLLRSITLAELERAARFAAACAAITVSRPGADPPRRSDLIGRETPTAATRPSRRSGPH